jgi:hypothetical protein
VYNAAGKVAIDFQKKILTPVGGVEASAGQRAAKSG